jgi:predicted small secreted protein
MARRGAHPLRETMQVRDVSVRRAGLLVLLLLLLSTSLAACDVFDSIQRPGEEIHMYGDAVDSNTFAVLPKAKIVIQLDGKTYTFTGSYGIMVPVYHNITIDATAPGYQPFHAASELMSMGYPELRSPLELHPVGST